MDLDCDVTQHNQEEREIHSGASGVVGTDERGFRSFLKAGRRVPKNLPQRTISQHVRVSREFEGFLRESAKKSFEDATGNDARRFIKHLAKSNRNNWDNLIVLLRYSRFAGNEAVELEMLKILDGAKVFDLLTDAVRSEVGREKADRILAGFNAPALGTSPKLIPKVTKRFMETLESNLDQNTCRGILLTGPHAGPPEAYADERKLLRRSKNVDEYLKKRRQNFVKELSDHRKNNTLFFNQRIDATALEFVKSNPEVAGGVRKGDKIYLTKIPYMMIEHLAERDKKLSRYYYCHCPLARESILSGPEISRNFCYCSAGYEKRPFDVAFGKSVKAEVLQSVLWGDPICRFSIEIPKEYLTAVRADRTRK